MPRVFAGRVFAGIEAGGTSFVVGAGTGPNDLATAEFPTTNPEDTITRCLDWLLRVQPEGGFAACGIASFGPVELARSSPRWGFITNTPKPLWRDFDFAGRLRAALAVPLTFDTDVNAALAGESRWGAARGIANCVYLTIGTGIGGAILADGLPVNGSAHPEIGHVRVPRDLTTDSFPGVCPFHGDCLEGLASAPALAARWGAAPDTLNDDHPAWALEAGYLAHGISALALAVRPQRVVLGGGVARRACLFPLVRERLNMLLGGYVDSPAVVPAELGARAGVLGAIARAEESIR